MTPRDRALGDLVDAARAIRSVNDSERAHVRHLQELAAEARRTGESQTHRIRPRAFDYGDPVARLLDALERYERATGTGPPAALRS